MNFPAAVMEFRTQPEDSGLEQVIRQLESVTWKVQYIILCYNLIDYVSVLGMVHSYE